MSPRFGPAHPYSTRGAKGPLRYEGAGRAGGLKLGGTLLFPLSLLGG